ncbi:MAG: putative nucleotidyltransferase component of viral defense system [Neolewinella sp.]|jgi:predicted nucleotidyltransferase component of viral defense system
MIHTGPQIIEAKTLQLLKEIQADELFKEFVLVGGTSLALQLGHRHSIDLDLFSLSTFNNLELEQDVLSSHSFIRTSLDRNTLKGFVSNVKVDFITHAYPWVEPIIELEGLRLATCLDVGAMKLNAISGSGQRQKDFYDMYFLLERYSLSEIVKAFQEKYQHSSPLVPVRALTYFEDVRFDIEPPELIKKVQFGAVKSRLIRAVELPDHRFSSLA